MQYYKVRIIGITTPLQVHQEAQAFCQVTLKHSNVCNFVKLCTIVTNVMSNIKLTFPVLTLPVLSRIMFKASFTELRAFSLRCGVILEHKFISQVYSCLYVQ